MEIPFNLIQGEVTNLLPHGVIYTDIGMTTIECRGATALRDLIHLKGMPAIGASPEESSMSTQLKDNQGGESDHLIHTATEFIYSFNVNH